MRTFNWSGYEWITQERYGPINPGKPYAWYDESATSVDPRTGYLRLRTQYNPKFFPQYSATPKVGMGLVSCTSRFRFGTFEVEARLPRGKHLWPAFWMWSWDSYPPELDVFEGYTDNREGYYDEKTSFIPGTTDIAQSQITPTLTKTDNWNILWNTHWRDQFGNQTNIGGVRGLLSYKDPTKHFIKYKAIWKPTEILIYYDKLLVGTFTDPVALNDFAQYDMNVIINNHPQPTMDFDNPTISSMVVKYFKHTPL